MFFSTIHTAGFVMMGESRRRVVRGGQALAAQPSNPSCGANQDLLARSPSSGVRSSNPSSFVARKAVNLPASRDVLSPVFGGFGDQGPAFPQQGHPATEPSA